MSENALTILSVISTICAIVFAYLAFARNRKKDDTDAGRNTGTMLSDIGYIKSGVDDIKAEQKEQRKTNIDVMEKIARAEESAKSAHKRIDGIESRIQHE